MIEKNTAAFDLQIERAKIWLKKSETFSNNDDTQMFAKFYFLWSAFNSLFNLAYDEAKNEIKRIEKIIKLIDEYTSNLILTKNKNQVEFIMNEKEPVKDEKHFLLRKYNQGYIQDYKEGRISPYDEKKQNEIYSDPESSFNMKLESVVLTIYQIRNNLTHGNKSGDVRDRALVKNSNPIIENLVKKLLELLENQK